jgi:hypothetical protein
VRAAQRQYNDLLIWRLSHNTGANHAIHHPGPQMTTLIEAAQAALERQVRPLIAGDIVRLKDPSRFIVSFAKKATDRDAVVLWVGPLAYGMLEKYAKVRFLKRNGRGKEFEETLRKEDLVLKQAREA